MKNGGEESFRSEAFFLILSVLRTVGSWAAPKCRMNAENGLVQIVRVVRMKLLKLHFYAFLSGVRCQQDKSCVSRNGGPDTVRRIRMPFRINFPGDDQERFPAQDTFLPVRKEKDRKPFLCIFICFLGNLGLYSGEVCDILSSSQKGGIEYDNPEGTKRRRTGHRSGGPA